MFTLDELIGHEKELQFAQFSNEAALKLGLLIVKNADAEEFGPVAVNIEQNGTTLFLHLMQGTTSDNIEWIGRKKRVVDRYHHSSMYVGELKKSKNENFNELLDAKQYQAVGGSFPLIIKDVGVVGSITVSGLPSHIDHKLCTESIREYLKSANNIK